MTCCHPAYCMAVTSVMASSRLVRFGVAVLQADKNANSPPPYLRPVSSSDPIRPATFQS
jgi:hypothetical protein